MRIKSEEFHSTSWDEFTDLLCGLNEQTPLVRVAQIRLETDPETLKGFTKEQRRMNSDWKARTAKKRTQDDIDTFLANMQKVFASMSGEIMKESEA